ncbi:hypothetical protein VTJ04DRAFT_10807 [Mycothermus thermophilus]|uniref:uncharacterized protein n=1 Tax=Humicola insolens TaxID=85995 RepID=UPI00374344DA
MPILIPDADVNGRTRAAIEQLAAAVANVGRSFVEFCHEINMPLLQKPDQGSLPCRESVEEFATVNLHFSTQLRALFEELAAYHARDGASSGTELAPIDDKQGFTIEIVIQAQRIDHDPYCRHRIYHARRLTLQNPETLPVLPFVRKLRILQRQDDQGSTLFAFDSVRPVALRALLDCIVHLPALQELDCPWAWEWLPVAAVGRPLRHFTRVWEGPWRDARHEFGAAVERQEELPGGLRIPSTLTKARLWFWQPRLALYDDQAMPMPDLVAPAKRDPLSTGLSVLVAPLHELDLRAIISEHLFPAPDAPASAQWSRMRRLSVEFHPMRPDGSWYFVGPRGEDPHPQGFGISEQDHYPPAETTDEDEDVDEQWDDDPTDGHEEEHLPDVFRTEPLAERIEPLLSAFATAVKNMGALEQAELFTYLAWLPSRGRAAEYGDEAPYDTNNSVHRWGVRYYVPEGAKEAVVEWQVGDWRPSQTVIDLFDNLGQQEWLGFEFRQHRDITHFTVAEF